MGERARAGWGGALPVLVLAVLAPVCVDVVFGATKLSTPFALVPEVLTYGVAAVLIREVTRAGRRGPVAVVLLGLAFAVVCECLVVQTSLAPGLGADTGRALGVNWPYLVWAVGYEAIWAILLPIRLTEALFPHRAASAWLGRGGRVGTGIVFVAGCLLAWYEWTRVVRPLFLGLPMYQPPWPTVLVAALVAAGLVLLALAGPVVTGFPRPAAGAPRPWLAGLVALLATLLWFGFTLAPPPGVAPVAGIVAALLLAAAVALTVARWSRAPGWSGAHGLALMAGALLGNSLAGFVAVQGYSTSDLLAKIVIDLVVLGLVGCAAALRRRPPNTVAAGVSPTPAGG